LGDCRGRLERLGAGGKQAGAEEQDEDCAHWYFFPVGQIMKKDRCYTYIRGGGLV